MLIDIQRRCSFNLDLIAARVSGKTQHHQDINQKKIARSDDAVGLRDLLPTMQLQEYRLT